ncbi:MAG: hypothetical protein DRG40_07030, partial [Deltaproteobacteria bacterium]
MTFLDLLLSKIWGPSSQWFWIMVQSLIILATACFIYYQVRLQRYSNMLQTLNEMRSFWNNEKMMNFRLKVCETYLTGAKSIGAAEAEVLGFFEEIGLLLKKHVLQKDVVWNTYSYFIEYYWT